MEEVAAGDGIDSGAVLDTPPPSAEEGDDRAC